MTRRIVISGTDTGVGKTVFAAALAGALNAVYWKPVQAGLEEVDSNTVQSLSGLPREQIWPEAYRLKTPASPHLSARLDGVVIDPASLIFPQTQRAVIAEAAGGLLVPLTPDTTYIDVMARWRAPVVLCARTTLGTINHSLLSIEALRFRNIPILGIAFIGEANAESERIICEMGRVRRLGRLPHLSPLTPEALRAAFAENFNVDHFDETSA